MITAMTDDLNETEIVSRDVESSIKNGLGSDGWIDYMGGTSS
jgi:hypothetical protein